MKRPLGRSVVFVAASLAGIVGIPLERPCNAQVEPESLVQQGIQFRREHRDEEALAAFEGAYRLAPTPRTRAQIALAEEALGRWVIAETDLEAALAHQDDPWIAAHHEALEESATKAAAHLARIRVTSNASATLRIDDGAALALPYEARVVVGRIRLRIEAPGHEPMDRRYELTAGAFLDIALALPPAAPAVQPSPPATPSRPPAPRSASAVHRTVGWIALGASSGPLLFAVLENIVRERQARTYNGETRCSQPSWTAFCNDERSRVEASTTLSVAGYATGLTLAVVGSALALWPERDVIRVSPSLSLRGAGATLVARF